jgi:hypothetical protein
VLTGNLAADHTTFTATALLACPPTMSSAGRMGVINFSMSSSPIPNYKIVAQLKSTDTQDFFAARFAIDKIVEYVEANNVPGFQPGQDIIIREYILTGTPSNPWSGFTRNTINLDSTTTVDQLTTTLTASFGSSLTFGAQITSADVVTGNTTKVVLTPDSFKTVFELDNIVYFNSSSRLAIGTIIVTKGKFTRSNETSTSPEGDMPYYSNANQGVMDISYDGSTTNGYFSWKRFVTGRIKEGFSALNYSLTESLVTIANNTPISLASDEAGFTLNRIFFTLNDRLVSFSWDPSLGVTDASNSPSSAVFLSVNIVLLVSTIVFTLLSILFYIFSL